MNQETIQNHGSVNYDRSIRSVHALSGCARDIQAAINHVSSTGGNVIIPAGTFNFYDVGETWQEVVIPAGVSLYGAPTVRDANDQVVEWKTVLKMPFNAPEDSWFFKVQGNGDYNKRTRISDIKLVGYRDMDPSISTKHHAIYIYHAIDWRVDHVFIKEFCEGIQVRAPADRPLRGVVDHCKFINKYGVPEINGDWHKRTNGYGVSVSREPIGSTYWDTNIDNILGHYTDYTVFIEDCYFERWRHCTASNEGVHYVFRYNIIRYDHCTGSLDAHGMMFDPGYVGARAIEVYNNELTDPISPGFTMGILVRGGGGVFFNNRIRGYQEFCRLSSDEYNNEITRTKDLWFWSNDVGSGTYVRASDGQREGVDYFLYQKPNYTPYVYPHPLTS